MAELWLLCEGDSDIPVLAAVLTRVLAADIIPKPSGGSSNAPSAAEYVARHHGQQGVTVAYLVDRDYCQRSVADATFTDKKRGFMWRRHAIESYLLAPAVIVEAFRSLKASAASSPGGGPSWVKTLPGDEAVVIAGLRAAATARAPEEALRLAVQRLWEDLSDTAGRIQKRAPSIPGVAHPDAAACRTALLDEVARLVAKAQEAAVSPYLEAASVCARYDGELARVSGQTYLNNLHYLEEFHGKDLASAFLEWLQREHKAGLSKKLFIRELEKTISGVYEANRLLYGTDDFLELANGVRALGGLPAIA